MAGARRVLSGAAYGLGLLASFGQKVDVVGIYANGVDAGAGGAAPGGVTDSLTGASRVTASFGQMFARARPLKATVRETSRVMEHPTESGVMLADHHVINPTEIDVPLVVPSDAYAETFSQIRQAWRAATLLSVKTRVGTYRNMIIADMPHEEDAAMFDAVSVLLRLRQVQYVTPGGRAADNFRPADAADSSTVAGGLRQAAALGQKLLAAAGSAASYAALARRF